MNEFICCPTDVWLETYAASTLEWPQAFVGSILTSLRRCSPKSDRQLNANGWILINTATRAERTENEIFASLQTIASRIACLAIDLDDNLRAGQWSVSTAYPDKRTDSEAAEYSWIPDCRSIQRTFGPQYSWQDLLRDPRAAEIPLSESQPSRSSRVSGTRTPDDDSGRHDALYNTSDTAAIGEFKLDNSASAKRDNESKILSAATKILRNDPCRRHVPAFTIENEDLRFWMFSRSHIAVSSGVDFHKRPEYLVRFFLYAIFGSPDKLGLDPTVGRVRAVSASGTIRYDYRYLVKNVNNGKVEVFQTIGDPIFEQSTRRVVSRATRVWEVRQVILDDEGQEKVDNEGDPVLSTETCVLKDVWLHDDARLEMEIQSDIFNRLGPQAKDARQYFLTILHDGVVQGGANMDVDDITPMCKPNDRCAPTWTSTTHGLAAHSVKRMYPRYGQAEIPKAEPQSLNDNPVFRNHSARKHVRTVFKERCQTIFELTDFKSLFQCLIGCVRALRYLQTIGYVHRDVSAGNCLFYRGAGKLADLEYSKFYKDISVSEPRTGTPDYMAVEHQYRSWLFMRSVPMLDFDSTQIKPLVEFMFHPLHDVESLWWILWWYVSHHVLVDVVKEMSSEDWMEHRCNIKTCQGRYFSSGIDGSPSRLSLITTSRITNEVGVLSPLYIGRRHFLSPLAFVTLLGHEYQAVHDHPPCQGEDGLWRLLRAAFTDNLHVAFEKCLQKALCSTEEVGETCSISDADVKTKNTWVAQTTIGSKRGRSTSDTETDRDVNLKVMPPPQWTGKS